MKGPLSLLPLSLYLVLAVVAQKPSPCPSTFDYVSERQQGRWDGEISLQTDRELNGVWLRILLDQPADLLVNYFGDAVTSDNKEFLIRNRDYKLVPGPPILIKFFIKYDAAAPVPSVANIRLNGEHICPKPNRLAVTSDGESTEVHVSHFRPTASTNRPRTTTSRNDAPSSGGNINSQSNAHTNTDEDDDDNTHNSSNGLDFFPGDTAAVLGSTNRPQHQSGVTHRPTFDTSRPIKCGTVSIKPSPLISHGQKTIRGQWPWHAALYHSRDGLQLTYTCGGTLVSETHVLTAAHCVTRPQTNRPIPTKNIIIYLGKHRTSAFGAGVQESQVERIYVHPHYNHSVFYNDIAILRLATPMVFDDYVRPCCLWADNEEGVDLGRIVSRLGTVVGWGFDQTHKLSTELMQAQMPVVSTSQCIFSNRDFFSRFMTAETYCAGFLNGTSVCNGDSGGGMVFPRSGTTGHTTVWQLRGIVSVGVALQGKAICDASQYIIFTDVAKHLTWVRSIIEERS